jgi:hypothetical protein
MQQVRKSQYIARCIHIVAIADSILQVCLRMKEAPILYNPLQLVIAPSKHVDVPKNLGLLK